MRIENVWPGWQTECEIGRGASAVVYRCVRNDNGINAYSAVKVITVPKDGTRTEYAQDATRMLYNESNGKRTVDSFVNEIKLLESLKGAPNIVSIDDFKVIEEEGRWQIFIRMELLTDLRTYFSQRAVTEGEVIKLGKDICAALTLCERNNIVHRDIKPENIFVSRFGDFKIGDFGIAKHRDNSMGTVSFKGTYNYIAPETVREFRNDIRSDMYSLGLVMYELLCGNLPFVYGNANQAQKEQALSRRLSGEPIPPLYGASGTLNHTLAKACAFNPAERFTSPEEFAQTLTASSTSTTVSGGNPFVPPTNEVNQKKNNKTLLIVAIAAVVVVLGVLTAVLILSLDNKDGGDMPQDEPAGIAAGSDYDEPATDPEETTEDNTQETTESTTTTTASTTLPSEPVTVPSLPSVTAPQITTPATRPADQPTTPTQAGCKNGHTTRFGYCDRCGEAVVEDEILSAMEQWMPLYIEAVDLYSTALYDADSGYHALALRNANLGNDKLKQAIDIAERYDEFDEITAEMNTVYDNMSVLKSISSANEYSTYLLALSAQDSLSAINKINRIIEEDWQPIADDYQAANS